ncbi:MAG: hypothetical protein V5A51_11845 [Bacteroidales bacterium]
MKIKVRISTLLTFLLTISAMVTADEPDKNKWFLIFQNRDSNYQPAFSTTTTISKPES